MLKWTGVITWNFSRFSNAFNELDFRFTRPENMRLVRQAFESWDSVLNIRFREVSDANANAEIQIGWKRIDGPGNTLGEAVWRSQSGELSRAAIRFDAEESWGSNARRGGDGFIAGSSMYAVALHEIGHAIGLEHDRDPNTVMHAVMSERLGLTPRDIAAGAALYGYRANADGFRDLRGGDLDDRLLGGGDAERMHGLGGRDVIRGAGADDELFGDAGGDQLFGDDGDDLLRGGRGKDTLFGGDGDDRLFGGQGKDEIRGGAGRDRLFGEIGGDRLYGGQGKDALFGGEGHDLLFGGAGGDQLFGAAGEDRLKGGAGHDLLVGGADDDRLYGGAGGDRLKGGAGRDALFGGAGGDTLVGGDGADEFHFRPGDGRDTLRGWQDGLDRIVVDSGAQRFGQIQITQRGAHALVVYGDSGDVIKLIGIDADDLDAGDFLFG